VGQVGQGVGWVGEARWVREVREVRPVREVGWVGEVWDVSLHVATINAFTADRVEQILSAGSAGSALYADCLSE
jgi:hypothetical protein